MKLLSLLLKMVTFSKTSIALKLNMFFVVGSEIAFEEFFAVYLTQLGFSSSQVGITSLFGVPFLFVPLFGFLGDRFKVRKLVLVILIVGLIFLCLAPLLPLAMIAKLQNCGKPSNFHSESHNGSCCSEKVNPPHGFGTETLVKKAVNLSFATPDSSNFSNSPNRTVITSNENQVLPSLSSFFVFMIFVKGFYSLVDESAVSLSFVAVATYKKRKKTNFGSYFCWGQIGGSFWLFAIGVIASHITLTICGKTSPGYFVVFPWAAASLAISLIAVPWMKYEYLDHRVVNWTEVKGILFDIHYIIMLFIGAYSGWCFSFQSYWEFWYIAELSGTPTVMAVGGLFRRPLVALWFRLSVSVIEKVGDLYSIASALSIFGVCQLALAFTGTPWLVLVIDVFQSAAYALAYSGLIVHFSKAGSKASSAVISALAPTIFAFGAGFSDACTGILFSAVGTKMTMVSYSVTTAVILVSLLTYMSCSKQLRDYEEIGTGESESEEGDE